MRITLIVKMNPAKKQITETIHESESPILLAQEDAIIKLTLNRPKQLNSLTE